MSPILPSTDTLIVDGIGEHQRAESKGVTTTVLVFHGFLFFLLQGHGDSEIALVVEDDDMINSTMNGMPYPVARFAATLRRQLYKGNNILLSFHTDLFRFLIVG